jgi:hypothetical protein
MAAKSVEALIDDLKMVNPERCELVEAVRSLVKKKFKPFSEEVKYGGILFSSGVQFCGVFAYKEHISVEFGQGAKIEDTFGFLEGAGKGRRHIKLASTQDIKTKKLAEYLVLALEAVKSSE